MYLQITYEKYYKDIRASVILSELCSEWFFFKCQDQWFIFGSTFIIIHHLSACNSKGCKDCKICKLCLFIIVSLILLKISNI